MAGALQVTLHDGTSVDASTAEAVSRIAVLGSSLAHGEQGVAIPAQRTIQSLDTRPLRWVLVVEKDVGDEQPNPRMNKY
jgi:hypothetical protein